VWLANSAIMSGVDESGLGENQPPSVADGVAPPVTADGDPSALAAEVLGSQGGGYWNIRRSSRRTIKKPEIFSVEDYRRDKPAKEKLARHSSSSSSSEDDDSSSDGSSSEDSEDSDASSSTASIAWKKEGHPYIGKRVFREYPNSSEIAQGVVAMYASSDGDDGALFHIRHDDGDEEDLDEEETKVAIEAHRRMNVTGRYNTRERSAIKPPERFTVTSHSTDPEGRAKKKQSPRRVARAAYERSMHRGSNRRRSRPRRPRRRHYDSSSESSSSDDGQYVGMNKRGASKAREGFYAHEQRRELEALNSIQPINGVGAGARRRSKQDQRDVARADALPLHIDSSVTFASVGGLEKHVSALKEMVTLPLLYPEVFSRFRMSAPRGVIFHGPPGTGKTLVARALANSCSRGGQHVSFFMRKGADCLSKWVGEAEKQLRLLFEQARRHQPAIIFFDEIDGLAPVRSSKQDQIHASIVSTLLALMDGLDDRGQVIVIGATNRIDSIDPALRRPGRFDRELLFGLPDRKARREIVDIHTQHWDPPLIPAFKDDLAEQCVGYCGADIKALCAEASLAALKRCYPEIYLRSEKLNIDVDSILITREDFVHAFGKVVPASRRSVTTNRQQLKRTVEPLLKDALHMAMDLLREVFPLQQCKALRRRTRPTISSKPRADPASMDTLDCNAVLPEFDPESPSEMRLLYGVDTPTPNAAGQGTDDEWKAVGNRWIGSRVRRYFEDFGVWANGTITRYLPPEDVSQGNKGGGKSRKAADSASALWHVEHDDGDEEDLEEFELTEAIGEYQKYTAMVGTASSADGDPSAGIFTTGNANALTLPLGSGSGVLSQEFSFNRPRLLIEGAWGMGQAHVARAILHALEEIPVFTLALSALVAEAKGGESVDVVCLRHIVEAKRSAPCVLYMPAIDTLWESIGVQMRRVILSAIDEIDPHVPVCVIAFCASGSLVDMNDLDVQKLFPTHENEGESLWPTRSTFSLTYPSQSAREAFFDNIFQPIADKVAEIQKQSAQDIEHQNTAIRKKKRRRASAISVVPPPQEPEPEESASDRQDDAHCLRELRIFLRTVLKELWKDRKFQPFFHAVDEEAVPDYYKIIKHPMDLDQISENIDEGVYTSIESFNRDMKLICTNAKTFNRPSATEGASLRGRQIIAGANQMLDTVNSFVHRFRKRLGYDLLERCANITKKLKSKRTNTRSVASKRRRLDDSGNDVSESEDVRPTSNSSQRKAPVKSTSNPYEVPCTATPGMTREERYRLRNGLPIQEIVAANGALSVPNDALPPATEPAPSILVDTEVDRTNDPEESSSSKRADESEDPVPGVHKLLSRLTSVQTKFVNKTEYWTICGMEDIYANLTRAMEPYYASALSLEVLLDQFESMANGLRQGTARRD
jgi:ATP-dependent 26S proteasome regulatory subunit